MQVFCFSAVDIRLLTLIFEVLHASHSLYDELRSLAAGEVYGEVVILLHLYLLLLFVYLAYCFDARFRGLHVFLAFVVAHSYHDFVEERQSAFHERVMAYGIWVEAANEYSCSHICIFAMV